MSTNRQRSVQSIAIRQVYDDVKAFLRKFIYYSATAILPLVAPSLHLFIFIGFKIVFSNNAGISITVWILTILSSMFIFLGYWAYGMQDENREWTVKVNYILFFSFFVSLLCQLVGCIFYPIFTSHPVFSEVNYKTGLTGLGLIASVSSIIGVFILLYKMYKHNLNKILAEPSPPYKV